MEIKTLESEEIKSKVPRKSQTPEKKKPEKEERKNRVLKNRKISSVLFHLYFIPK